VDGNDLLVPDCGLVDDQGFNGLPRHEVEVLKAHQLGHIIDRVAGPIPTDGLEDELQAVYDTLNNPNRTSNQQKPAPDARPFLPEHRGFTGEAVAREYIAEAIRAYLTDPNYLKTVAPRTAAAIRAAVNPNPRLNNIIQFN
jgi:hypothetical protein